MEHWSNAALKKATRAAWDHGGPLAVLDAASHSERVRAFFASRLGPDGRPVSDLLATPPKDCGGGWFRHPWRPFAKATLEASSTGPHAWNGKAEWTRAFHGCPPESVYSIMYSGELAESDDPRKGHTMKQGVPGVYMCSADKFSKAAGYARFVDIFGDGYYWACLWELRVDRAWRRCLQASDQWVQPRGSCKLAALWLCSRCPAQMQHGCEVSLWNPLKEANPRA